jgi:acylphosphatase
VAEVIGRKVRVFGRVQGVFYRQWAVHLARALGVAGWVHNSKDGTVEAHLEGEEEAVLEMIEQMRDGPPHAHVEDVNAEPVEPEGLTGFSVRL